MPSAPPPLAPVTEEPGWEDLSWSHLDDDEEEEAGGGQSPQPAAEATFGLSRVMLMPADDSRFIRFKIMWRTTFFEVTAKYGPPIGYVGGGAYGAVCYAFDTTNQKKVAIKKIENAFEDAIQAKNVLREVMLLRHMNHCNVVAMVDIIPPAQRDLFSDVYIASDLILTDMHKVIHSDQDVSADRRKWFMFQLLCGLKYLHTKHVLHRDLKPSNLLLTAD